MEVPEMRAGSYALLTVLTVTAGDSLTATSEVDQEPPLQCLPLIRISQLSILDNRHLVFRLNNGKRYLNTLPYTCPGLRPGTAILYRTSLDRLCDLDVITVLNSVGSGYMPGASCGLGAFTGITETEFKALKGRLKQ
jgi:hypothetical protein